MFERLTRVASAAQPSGVMPLAALAKLVHEPEVLRVCMDAVRVVDPRANGIFLFDLRADDAGRPKITEINVGRFGLSAIPFDQAGRYSMAELFVRTALGEIVTVGSSDDDSNDWYMIRDFDREPLVVRTVELFEGLREVVAR